MHIVQITTDVVGKDLIGKWYCCESLHGVAKYLGPTGTWQKNAHYFDSKEEIPVADPFIVTPGEVQRATMDHAEMLADLAFDDEFDPMFDFQFGC